MAWSLWNCLKGQRCHLSSSISTWRPGKSPFKCFYSEEILLLTTFRWLCFVTLCTYAFLLLISFMHSSLFSIIELINIITSNYRLVDDNFINIVILFRSPVFHDTFWTNKVSLSSANHSIFYIYNFLHFTSFWRFSKMMTVGDHKILMRDRCIKCGGLRSFSATLYGAFSLVFCFYVFWSQFVTFSFSWFSCYYDIWVSFQFIFLFSLII